MKRRFSGGDDLPEELEDQILLKLPVKSLLQFRSVSKSWNSQITTQKFVNDYLRATINKRNKAFADKNSPSLLLVFNEAFQKQPASLLTISDSTTSLKEISVPNILEDIPEYFFRPVFSGHCNGIICLVYAVCGQGERVLFYNQVLREQQAFRTPRVFPEYKIIGHAFGHDPKTDDYKFVKILNSRYANSSSKAEVYSIRSGLLSKFEMERRVSPNSSSGTYLKGCCYWVDHAARNLLSFDMSDERFSSLGLPWTDRSAGPWVMVRGESLVCVSDTFEVWVLDEDGGGWAKQFKIKPSVGLLRPVLFWKEDEVLVELELENWDFCRLARISTYNLHSKRFRKLSVRGTLSLYVESLVSVLGH